MLTFEKKLNHTLRIRISEEYKSLVNITVFDSNSRIAESQSSNRNEVSFALPQGLYTLRIEMNGDIKDEVILIDKEKEYQIGDNNSYTTENIKVISPPKQFSSALLSGTYGSSHEYYAYPTIEWSKKETFQYSIDSNGLNSSLFIFLRFSSVEKFDKFRSSFSKPFYTDFEIVDEYGSAFTQFETKSGIEINEQQGWIAFNAKLPNGIYYLLYKGKEPRQIPIYIYKNWHTQFFMTLGNQPLFGTIRVFLSRNREFNPNEITYKYIDILLDKIQNQDFSLDNELILMAASGKYESPMLGLICSYIYLQSKESQSDDLFNIILKNLQNLILRDNEESPDLRALNILAVNDFTNYKYKKGSIKSTPMLRIGFEAILKASVQNTNLIPQNSINDFISENLYYDSPFNTFRPLPFAKNPFLEVKAGNKDFNKMEVDFDYFEKNEIYQKPPSSSSMGGSSSSGSHSLNPTTDIFDKSIKTIFNDRLFSYIQHQNNLDIENSWIKNSIADIVKYDTDISINDISNNLNISGNTVSRIFNGWRKEVKEKHGK